MMLPSGNLLQFAIGNGPVEIVDLPIIMVMFHSYVNVYQRVHQKTPFKKSVGRLKRTIL